MRAEGKKSDRSGRKYLTGRSLNASDNGWRAHYAQYIKTNVHRKYRHKNHFQITVFKLLPHCRCIRDNGPTDKSPPILDTHNTATTPSTTTNTSKQWWGDHPLCGADLSAICRRAQWTLQCIKLAQSAPSSLSSDLSPLFSSSHSLSRSLSIATSRIIFNWHLKRLLISQHRT